MSENTISPFMNKYFVWFISLIVAVSFNSCDLVKTSNEIKLIPVKAGKVFEYIDQEGKIIINPQFNEATVFRSSIALVKSSGTEPKWGFISEEGKYIITPTYKRATTFNENIAWVVSENGPPTAINSKGEIKFTLPIAQTVRSFHDGFGAYSLLQDGKQKWGFVGIDGKVKINPQFSSAGDFHEGKCAVKNEDGKWGYIDQEGKITINYQFDEASNYKNSAAPVTVGGKSGVIDEKGKYLINPQFSLIVIDGNMCLFKQDGKYGWCDMSGKFIINPQFDDAYPFWGNTLAPVKSGSNYGYVDSKGKIIINPQFDEAMPFIGKAALVSTGKKIGFIDKEGKYVVNPQFDDITQDIYYYLSGGSQYGSVETDYFNVSAITDRITRDVTEISVNGLDFETSISTILTKYNKTENDISKYSSEHKMIANEKVSNDASLDFYVIGKPWNSNLDLWSGNSYSFLSNYKPTSYAYSIHLLGNGVGKEQDVMKALENAFSHFKKDEQKSNKDAISLNGSKFKIIIANVKSEGIVVIIEPLGKSIE